MKKIILMLFLVASTLLVKANLMPGDIVVIGFNTTGTYDEITIMATKSFSGQSFKITDAGWVNGVGFRTGEGYLTSRISAMTKGEIIKISLVPNLGNDDGGDPFYVTGNMNLAASGDQILIYTGTQNAPTFIYGLNYNAKNWTDAIDASTSALPLGLVNGQTAVSLINKSDYKYAQKIDISDLSYFLSDLGNYNSWMGKTNIAQNISAEGFLKGNITKLQPGDVAVIGYNDRNTNQMIFVAMRAIEEGTQIKITDKGWFGSNFSLNEGTLVYTVPTGGLAAGQVFTYGGADFYSTESFALSYSGDQILLYQGSETKPRFIYAYNARGVWDGTTIDAQRSMAPTDLALYHIDAIRIGKTENGNGYYSGSHTGTREELLTRFADPAFYTFAGGTNQIIFPTIANFIIVDKESCSSSNTALSNNQNYILSKTFKIAGVNNANVNDNRGICEVNQTIQYIDGLGRPSQTVQWQASPSKKDIVQLFEYDSFGREVKKNLPYAESSSNDGSFKTNGLANQINFYSNSTDPSIKQTNAPFSITIFEPSPLNRVLEQGATGTIWQPAATRTAATGRTNVTVYDSNSTNDAVKLWELTNNGAITTTNYLDGKLYKTIIKDENWESGKVGTLEEYRDFDNRLILKKIWETELSALSTYYVYDDFGNLRYVIPPAVNVNSFTESDAVCGDFIYAYHYDQYQRLVEKRIPGKGWEFMIYNSYDKLIMTQDANQRNKTPQEWSFNKYDALGRVILTGIYKYSGTSADDSDTPNKPLNAALQAMVNTNAQTFEERMESGIGYTSNAFPTNNISEYHTINYYDDYNFYNNTLVYNSNVNYPFASNKTKGLLTGSRVMVLGENKFLLSVNYYDDEGRVIQTINQNNKDGKDINNYTYNFAGELIETARNHSSSENTSPKTVMISNNTVYDHLGRKIKSKINIDGQGEITLNEFMYNELGQLKRKSLHNGLQGTDYAYNERGWLSGSSSAQFSMELGYTSGGAPQYNGNIAEQKWGAGTSLPNVYSYFYDRLNRLKKGSSTGIVMSEELTYDAMGNISTLNRDNTGARQYSYVGNRLIGVAGLTARDYRYDANGNATTDGRTGALLEYNHLDLPKAAVIGGTTLSYTYDATGRKLRKTSSTGGITDYVDGIQYQDGAIDFVQTEEGRAVRDASGRYKYVSRPKIGLHKM